jgi:ribosomal protein S27AE
MATDAEILRNAYEKGKKNSGNAIVHSSPANRRCPRCGGNLFFDRDYRGWYLECLQCSYTRELEIKVDGK